MHHLRHLTLTVVVLLQTTSVVAGNPIKLLKKVGTFIDSASVKGVDRRYIDAPKEPWQIMLKGNVNQSDLKMAAEDRDEFLSLSVEPRLKTKPSSYAGVWAGNITDEEIRNRTKSDPHSLGRWRVNGALPHIDAWYEAFGVKPADKMFIPQEQRLPLG